MCSERVDHVPDGRVLDGLVLDLGRAGSAPLRLVGGKAMNLGRLAAAGFPVPRGFCLTTVAYRKAAPPELEALAAQLDAALPGWSPDGGTAHPALDHPDLDHLQLDLGELARQAREMIVTAPIPADVD